MLYSVLLREIIVSRPNAMTLSILVEMVSEIFRLVPNIEVIWVLYLICQVVSFVVSENLPHSVETYSRLLILDFCPHNLEQSLSGKCSKVTTLLQPKQQ